MGKSVIKSTPQNNNNNKSSDKKTFFYKLKNKLSININKINESYEKSK